MGLWQFMKRRCGRLLGRHGIVSFLNGKGLWEFMKRRCGSYSAHIGCGNLGREVAGRYSVGIAIETDHALLAQLLVPQPTELHPLQ